MDTECELCNDQTRLFVTGSVPCESARGPFTLRSRLSETLDNSILTER